MKFKPAMMILIAISLFGAQVWGSAKTLPQGVWNIGAQHVRYDLSRVGGESYTTDMLGNVNGQGDWQHVDLEDYTVKYIPRLIQLNMLLSTTFGGALGIIDPELQLADAYFKCVSTYSLAYGLTDRITVFAQVPYVVKELHYHQDYIDRMAQLNASHPALDAAINVPPSVSAGRGWGDCTVGVKYGLNDHFAMALTAKTGILNTGEDATELPDRTDGNETLNVGDSENRYTYVFFYDADASFTKLSLTGSYMYSTAGYERILDNDYVCDNGDVTTFVIETENQFFNDYFVGLRYVYISAEADKKKVDGDWTTIPDTAIRAGLLGLTFKYKPVVFAEAWINYSIPITNQVAGGVYDFPGRLDVPAVVSLGTNIYFK